ncbi:MAG: hypothetical protein ACR2I0_08090, partial [Rhodoferax sp.]
MALKAVSASLSAAGTISGLADDSQPFLLAASTLNMASGGKERLRNYGALNVSSAATSAGDIVLEAAGTLTVLNANAGSRNLTLRTLLANAAERNLVLGTVQGGTVTLDSNQAISQLALPGVSETVKGGYVDEVQTFSLAGATGGSYTLGLLVGSTTYSSGVLAYNATASTIQSQLNVALGSAGSVSVKDGAVSGSFAVTFTGALAGQDTAALALISSLTGAGAAGLSASQLVLTANASSTLANLSVAALDARLLQTGNLALSLSGSGSTAVQRLTTQDGSITLSSTRDLTLAGVVAGRSSARTPYLPGGDTNRNGQIDVSELPLDISITSSASISGAGSGTQVSVDA